MASWGILVRLVMFWKVVYAPDFQAFPEGVTFPARLSTTLEKPSGKI